MLEKALIFWAAVTSRMYLHYMRDRPIKLQIVKSNYYHKSFGRRSNTIPSHIAFVFRFFSNMKDNDEVVENICILFSELVEYGM